ncbi:radical SAM protein, partial [Candidatus Pelagibacter sp.]|nr:radical SAM protein [Candidatus Pelagibacter sp.]
MKEKEKKLKVLLVYPNLPLMLVPPLSMAIFTKLLQDQKHEVELFDTTPYIPEDINSSPQNRTIYLQARDFSDEDDLGVSIKTNLIGDYKEKVFSYKPDLIIYSLVEDAFFKALTMMDAIKDYKCVKISGGVLPTADPEHVISKEQINFIALGEGEVTLIDVADAVKNKKNIKNLKGTWFKDESGKVHKNPKNQLVDINNSVPDYSLFDEKRFFRPMGGKIFKTIPIETYRGCPYKCTFCNSPMHNTQVSEEKIAHSFLRRKTIENVRKEILDLKNKYNPGFLYFVDDSFLARPRKEIFEFCDMYEEFKIPFWFNTRPENCKVDFLKRLKEIGAYRISFGVECGNPDFRQKVLLRKPTNKEIIDSFKVIEESGIAFSVNLIIG